MRVSVDLTKQKFEDCVVTFYDCKTIFFDPTTFLPSTVSFKIWGVGLMPDFDWTKYLDPDQLGKINSIREVSPNNETTIQGFGTLTFKNVVAGRVSIFPYDGGDLLKNKGGKQIEYKRNWTLENVDDVCSEYWLDADIYFPYGACDLKLYAKGDVIFEFDSDDCVSYHDYVVNSNRQDTFWGFLKDETLTTNSYRYEELDPKNEGQQQRTSPKTEGSWIKRLLRS